ncbi:hypothetical protein JHK87_022210 [Glycine soja]|nr:hypothetical protein JHK87_022210 [Glycine soja]
MKGKPLCLILLFALSLFTSHSNSLPLSTNKRWIVEESGKRMKMHCVNWSSHLNSMLGEGLDLISLKDLIGEIKKLGFNCVRYTWATHMFTRYSSHKVGETLDSLKLHGIRLGLRPYNPSLETVTLVEAFDAVIDEFGRQGMMVLADNHVSDPKWCCGDNDGNGFFGDEHFNPEEWLQGLSMIANRVKGKSQVVAIVLRNELRSWSTSKSRGLAQVHESRSSNSSQSKSQCSGVCFIWRYILMHGPQHPGFLMRGQNPGALVMSEFGMDMTKRDEKNNRFMSCMLAYLARVDLDWALWTAQGGYYVKEQDRIVGNHELELGDCEDQSRWSQEGQEIKLVAISKCIKTIGDGSPLSLSNDCKSKQSSWKTLSASNLHLGTIDEQGHNLCLERESPTSSKIVTKICICVDDNPACLDNPQS